MKPDVTGKIVLLFLKYPTGLSTPPEVGTEEMPPLEGEGEDDEDDASRMEEVD